MSKAGVVVFPGSNCDQDLVEALQKNGFKQVVKLWHKQTDLEDCRLIFLPGGFSYGDYLRSGAIARFSPIMKEVVRFSGNGGFVMGICNGFQILTEAGLLPGALLRNRDQQFICDFVHLKTKSDSLLTGKIPSNQTIKIPIAHGEGRYYSSKTELTALEDNNQIVFEYVDEAGLASDAANPNGSLRNIAGVASKGKNVFGMMPHPERVADVRLGHTDGNLIFKGILEAFS
jgi:phosphoribosylformylglycinamidine synthase